MKEPPFPMLAQGKVRFVGDMVAFVVADTLEQARAAAEAVVIDYEVLPAVVGVLEAVRPGAPQLFDDVPNNLCCDWELGDKAAVGDRVPKAAHVARLSLVNNRLIGNPMEPRAAIAEYNGGTGHYTLWTTSQFPHVVRFLMSALVLNIPEQKMRVVAPDVGGGFGVKQFHYGEEAVITWAARRVGRPVKWVADRSRRFCLRPARPRSRHRGRARARRERKIPGVEGRTRRPIWAAISPPLVPTSRPTSMLHC